MLERAKKLLAAATVAGLVAGTASAQEPAEPVHNPSVERPLEQDCTRCIPTPKEVLSDEDLKFLCNSRSLKPKPESCMNQFKENSPELLEDLEVKVSDLEPRSLANN